MSEPISGQCLCGAVTFRISGDFDSFFLCHCTRCRKGSGSAHSANLFSATAQLDWLSGQEQVQTFRLEKSRHERSFCKVCGAALPRSQAEAGLVVVPAGSLDTPITIRPVAHICMSSRAQWDKDLGSLPKIDGLPG